MVPTHGDGKGLMVVVKTEILSIGSAIGVVLQWVMAVAE